MTTIDQFDPFERRITEAIVEIAAERRPDYLDSVLQVTARSRQRPRWALPERWLNVNRMTLAAAAVAVVLLLGGGAIVLTRFNNNPSNGGLPTRSPSASPSATPPRPAAMPATILGDWHADNVAIPGVSSAQLVRLSLDWGEGMLGWIQLDGDGSGRHVLQFTSMSAAEGELRVRGDDGVGCAVLQEGRYRWSRSADGLFLTLGLIEDTCQARATAFARTWVHSLSAVTDGGLGILPWGPWIEVTLPKQKMGLGGGTDAAELKTYGSIQPFRAFVVIKNVGGFGDPCSSSDPKKIDIAHTTAAFVSYMKAFPGATITTSNTTIAGRPAVKVDVSIDAGLQCRNDGAQAYHPSDLSEDVAWGWSPGEAQPVYIMQFDADTTILIWYQGPAGEEQPVLDSMTFLDELPSPTS
jgi:hypothetical protein